MSGRYLAWRLAQVLPTTAGILLLGFLLVHLAPGDPVLALAGANGDAAYYARVRQQFGLDRPLPDQLVTYVANVLRGDLGTSYLQGRPVLAVIGERLPATLLLTGTALIVSTVLGIGLGTATAAGGRRSGRLLDATALAGFAAPAFFVGQLAVLTLALGLGWFPVQGMTTARGGATGPAAVADVARHLVLPAAVLATQELAAVFRLTRASLATELSRDHVRTARAKGVAEPVVLVRHALRQALLPVVTVLGGRVGHLVAGAVVVESVFGWPGIGRLLVGSVQDRDTPIVLGLFLLIALSVVVANLLTDLLYAWLDPRIRYR